MIQEIPHSDPEPKPQLLTGTNFVAGLLPTDAAKRIRHQPLLQLSTYYPPKHIDRRSELLSASNQGPTSKCVAYAIAGWIEHYRWKYDGVPQQIDPDPIYARAKAIDGMPNEQGTTMEAGVQAAQDLGLIAPILAGNMRELTTEAQVKQALHRHGVVLAAFTATQGWMTPTPDGWMTPDQKPLGGHCCLLCGYAEDEAPNYYSIQQSWGGELGWFGFVRMTRPQFAVDFQFGLCWEYNVSLHTV